MIDEAVADIISSVVARDFGSWVPNYGQPTPLFDDPERVHIDQTYGEYFAHTSEYSCSVPGVGKYEAGRPFVQAFWEIAFDLDCTVHSCNDTMPDLADGYLFGYRYGYVGWQSRDEATYSLTRALAVATAVSSSNPSIAGFIAWFLFDLGAQEGWIANGKRAAADSIFGHHGL